MSKAKPKASDLIIVAKAKAKPGREGDLERALKECAGPTREQPGCVEFILLRDATDPAVMVGFERWSSAADHDRHLNGAHVQKLFAAMGPVLAEPPSIATHQVVDGG